MTLLATAIVLASAPFYPAKLVYCHDGDTCRFDILLEERSVDLGFGVWTDSQTWLKQQTVRLASIDAPELADKGGVASRDALTKWVREAKNLRLDHAGRDKYGRWLVYVMDGPENINFRMQAAGFARPWLP